VPGSSEEIVGRVEALGFGFLVPLFYIVTGIEFDLDALLHDTVSLLLVPAFLALFLLVRGGPVYLFAPRDLGRADRLALALFSATCLPLVVALTTIGVDQKLLGTDRAASLVCAAMLSVLLLPALATRVRARAAETGEPATSAGPPERPGEESEAW
ncbi:cation:proton antiporter, partial [Streptomyces sp. SID11233]|nr:cation:proton antiporter [Streptomyces sp. SID11233]